MSTPCMIWLKLRKEDYGKTIMCDAEKLPNKLINLEFDFDDVKLPNSDSDNLYVGIYVHFDGYQKGVGKELLEKFKTYEDVLNLISLGDCSRIIDHICSYHLWRCEGIKLHKCEDERPTRPTNNHYCYIFEDNNWRHNNINFNN